MYCISLKTFLYGALLLVLTACVQDQEADTSQSKISTQEALIKITSLPFLNDVCPYSGYEFLIGVDLDNDGDLSNIETDYSKFVIACNSDSNAHAGLEVIYTVSESDKNKCPAGGKNIVIGWDENEDEKLQSSEISYDMTVCNVQFSGVGEIINIVSNAKAEECDKGGLKVDSGVDQNANGQLELSEIKNSRLICSSMPVSMEIAHIRDDIASLLSSDEILLESEVDARCLHGGKAHYFWFDDNADGEGSLGEIASVVFACNPNNPPRIAIEGNDDVFASSPVNITLYSSDEDGVYERTELSITEKPSWLIEERVSANEIRLYGTAPESIGGVFNISAVASDSEKTTAQSFVVVVTDGVYATGSADPVLEGDNGVIKTGFIIQLSHATNYDVELQYSMYSYTSDFGVDWSALNPIGTIVIPAGQTSYYLPVDVYGDIDAESGEVIALELSGGENSSQGIVVNSMSFLHILNNDALVFESGSTKPTYIYRLKNDTEEIYSWWLEAVTGLPESFETYSGIWHEAYDKEGNYLGYLTAGYSVRGDGVTDLAGYTGVMHITTRVKGVSFADDIVYSIQ